MPNSLPYPFPESESKNKFLRWRDCDSKTFEEWVVWLWLRFEQRMHVFCERHGYADTVAGYAFDITIEDMDRKVSNGHFMNTEAFFIPEDICISDSFLSEVLHERTDLGVVIFGQATTLERRQLSHAMESKNVSTDQCILIADLLNRHVKQADFYRPERFPAIPADDPTVKVLVEAQVQGGLGNARIRLDGNRTVLNKLLPKEIAPVEERLQRRQWGVITGPEREHRNLELEQIEWQGLPQFLNYVRTMWQIKCANLHDGMDEFLQQGHQGSDGEENNGETFDPPDSDELDTQIEQRDEASSVYQAQVEALAMLSEELGTQATGLRKVIEGIISYMKECALASNSGRQLKMVQVEDTALFEQLLNSADIIKFSQFLNSEQTRDYLGKMLTNSKDPRGTVNTHLNRIRRKLILITPWVYKKKKVKNDSLRKGHED